MTPPPVQTECTHQQHPAPNELDIVREALLHLRGTYRMWLSLKHTSEMERRLAAVKIALIDRELEELP